MDEWQAFNLHETESLLESGVCVRVRVCAQRRERAFVYLRP